MTRLALIGLLSLCGAAAAAECPSGVTADALEERAQAAFDARRLADAAKAYRDLTCLDPKNARAFYALGIAEAALRNYAPAIAALRKADELAPSNPSGIAMLVNVQLAVSDREGAAASLRAAALRFPKHGQLHSELSKLLAGQGHYDLALAESLRWERTGETDPDAMLALAALENRNGAHADAVRHASAVAADPSLPAKSRASAATVAGLSHDALEHEAEAIRALQQASALDPVQETPYLALASIYERKNDYVSAAKVLSGAGDKIPVLIPLSANLLTAGQYDAAVEVLRRILAKDPAQLESYERLAEAYRALGQHDRRTATLRELAKRKPDYPMIHVLLAQALLDSGAPDQAALDELALAHKADPNDADIYYLRSKIFLARGQLESAVAAGQRAIELRPSEASFYYPLGQAYSRLGQRERSREILNRMEYVKKLAAP